MIQNFSCFLLKLRRGVASMVVVGLAGAVVASPAALALEFKQITENGTILFDAPSAKSSRLFILGSGLPVEVIVSVAGWIKVRDAGGALGWIETRQAGVRNNVQVRSAYAEVRAQPADNAPLVFAAEKDVLISCNDTTPLNGWVRVVHRDGAAGFVRAESVFGL